MTPRRLARRGATAVEFGLTLPILVVTVGAVFDYGLFTYQQNAITHAVRDGVRIGITGDPNLSTDDPDHPVNLSNDRLKEVLLGMGLSCDDDSSSVAYNCTIETEIKDATSGSFQYLETYVVMDYNAPVGLTPVPDQLTIKYVMALAQETDGFSEPPVCNP